MIQLQLLVLLIVFSISLQVDPAEENSLRMFYDQCGGHFWTGVQGWLQGEPCDCTNPKHFDPKHHASHWTGVFCDKSCTHITALRLVFANITCAIPESIFKSLPFLIELDLANNQLHGRPPESLWAIPTLKAVTFQNNKFAGALPVPSNTSVLQRLDFGVNLFAGTIPSEYNQLSALETLILSTNQLEGTIPDLSALHELNTIDFGENRLVGNIPLWFSQLPRLVTVQLDNNYLSGEIPADLWAIPIALRGVALPLAELVVLDVQNNNLTGEVAAELFELPKISYIYLGGNSDLRVGNGSALPRSLTFSSSDFERLPEQHAVCSRVHGKTREIVISLTPDQYSYLNCTCNEGYFSNSLTLPSNHSELACTACLPNTLCPAGSSRMSPQPGFWGTPDELPLVFLPCISVGINRTACNPAGRTLGINICADGYEGRLCSQCTIGHYRFGVTCVPCTHSIRYVVPSFYIAAFFLGLYYLFRVKHLSLAVLKTTLFFLQTLSLLGGLGVPLPAVFATFTTFASAINLTLPGSECWFGGVGGNGAAGDDFLKFVVLILTLPVSLLVVTLMMAGANALYLKIRQRMKPRDEAQRYAKTMLLWQRATRAYCFLLTLSYLKILNTILQLFVCDQDPVTAVSYLRHRPAVVCSWDSEWGSAVVMALITLVGYGVGLPVVFSLIIWRHRHELLTNSTLLNTLGYLYEMYKPKTFYWDAVVTLRRLLMAVCLSFLGFDTIVLPLAVFSILMLATFSQRLFLPFSNKLENHVELAALLLLLFNFYCTSVFWLPHITPTQAKILSAVLTIIDSIAAGCFTLLLIAQHSARFLSWLQRKKASAKWNRIMQMSSDPDQDLSARPSRVLEMRDAVGSGSFGSIRRAARKLFQRKDAEDQVSLIANE